MTTYLTRIKLIKKIKFNDQSKRTKNMRDLEEKISNTRCYK